MRAASTSSVRRLNAEHRWTAAVDTSFALAHHTQFMLKQQILTPDASVASKNR